MPDITNLDLFWQRNNCLHQEPYRLTSLRFPNESISSLVQCFSIKRLKTALIIIQEWAQVIVECGRVVPLKSTTATRHDWFRSTAVILIMKQSVLIRKIACQESLLTRLHPFISICTIQLYFGLTIPAL